jgi:hypothetical protein
MGMVVISSTIAIGQVSQALDEDASPSANLAPISRRPFRASMLT